MTTELLCVGLGGILVIIYILAAALPRLFKAPQWAAGNRDAAAPDTGVAGQRADRAVRNILETYPVFAASALAVVVAGGSSGLSEAGAIIYVVARALYLPAYILPLGPIRSLIWGASMAGIALVLIALFSAGAPADLATTSS